MQFVWQRAEARRQAVQNGPAGRHSRRDGMRQQNKIQRHPIYLQEF
ncbi:hypothetical protein LMG23992_00066 [Cupriavidus laharis]|uniref:Uncharacterized protein n=1 Tax=Cupriavidus laharis TaxID=151654 RepID=A0ABN7XZ07_9BURK|nr:hypothetical protein LMG23992_00066 [Cupriavidus laharis]